MSSENEDRENEDRDGDKKKMYKRRRQTEKIGKDINKQTMRIKMETKQKLRIEIKTETDRQILGIKMEPEIENNPPIKDIEISVNLAT